ncbi:MAG: hypothetical protein RMY16_24250 [Nostoc sp. DedQUE12b]|uniref:hypothetical protein n=1 Tax=unclassified Nostoc TaxID=2593658 RepID=UPI002AD37525|nr:MULTISPECIES: hypothetical protein [unclassified Nostoc]MDZ7955449.1 hypothetical protein [Nostoc sp. DedQUE09]MDZ8088642.1 hypothetical protein [Nostoc sp. DedQUE12b]
MKTKIFGFALMLSLAAILGACEGGGGDGAGTSTPAATGEPTDAPAVKTTPATPAATTPAAPATTAPATPK